MPNITKHLPSLMNAKEGGIIVRDADDCLYLAVDNKKRITEENIADRPIRSYRLFSPNINRTVLVAHDYMFRVGAIIIGAASDKYALIVRGDRYSTDEMLYALEHVDICTFVLPPAVAMNRVSDLQGYVSAYKHTYCSYRGNKLSTTTLEQAKVVITLSKVTTCFNTFGKDNEGLCVSIRMYCMGVSAFSTVLIGSAELHGPFYLDGEFRLPIKKVVDVTKFFVPLRKKTKKVPTASHNVTKYATMEVPEITIKAGTEDWIMYKQHLQHIQQLKDQAIEPELFVEPVDVVKAKPE